MLGLCLAGCTDDKQRNAGDSTTTMADANTDNDADPVSPLQPQLHAATTVERIAPGVFLQDERFAESIASSHDGTIVFTTLPLEGAVQVHFYNQQQWVSSDSIQVVPAYSESIIDIASSGNADMLAILVAATAANAWQATFSIVERVGESWILTGAVALPASTIVTNTATFSLSTTGDRLLLRTANQVLLYQRGTLDWVLSQRFTAPSDNRITAIGADEHFSRLQILLQRDNQFKLFSTQLAGSGTVETNVLIEDWSYTDATHIQGLDADSEVLLQPHRNGTSLIIAGWQNAASGDRSPVLWRYGLEQPDARTGFSTLDVLDFLRVEPTTDAQARLRFSASNELDTVVIGWHSAADDDARLTSYQYNENQLRWDKVLELPDAMPTLARQGFAGEVLLTANGETLLVAIPAGNATSPDNHVGELIVFR